MPANTGQIGPDNAWLATLAEDILEPDLPVIDPHHHLWIRNGYTYLLPELAEDLNSGHRIVATVYAECHSMYRAHGEERERSLGETEFVRGQAAMSASGEFGPARACDVLFGNVDLTLGGQVRPLLESHLEISGGRFRGVRISSGWHADDGIHNVAERDGLLLESAVSEAVSVLGDMGLSLDVWLYHTQLEEFAQLVDAHSGVTFVLNHVGSPILGGPYRGQVAEVMREWKRSMAAVARRPNVYIKLGAMPIRMPDYAGDRTLPPSSEEVAVAWRPWIEPCIELFGAERSMFESNFPVQKRWCSYQICWNAFKRIAGGATVSEKRALFSGSAAAAYRIEGAF